MSETNTATKDVVKKTASSSKTSAAAPKRMRVSRTKISDIMRNSVGKFCTVTFVKQDGSERTINGKANSKGYMDNLGYVRFKDNKGNYKLVDPRTTKELHCNNTVYYVQ